MGSGNLFRRPRGEPGEGLAKRITPVRFQQEPLGLWLCGLRERLTHRVLILPRGNGPQAVFLRIGQLDGDGHGRAFLNTRSFNCILVIP
jgi:hypothetical protein